MARKKKTGLPAFEWRKIFGAIARYCAKNRTPGEAMNQCVKRIWDTVKLPTGQIDLARLRSFIAGYIAPTTAPTPTPVTV